MSIIVFLLICFGSAVLMFLLSLAVFVIFDNYYRKPNFFKGVILTKQGNYKIRWLKKTGKKEGKFNIATLEKTAFLYNDADVIKVNKYDALFIKEDSGHAIRINTDSTKFLDKTTINPQSMKDLCETKLIDELVTPKINVKDIIMMIGIAICILGLALLYMKVDKTHKGMIEMRAALANIEQIISTASQSLKVMPR